MKRNRYQLLKTKLFFAALRKRKITFRKLWNVFLCSCAFLLKSKKSAPSPFILSLELWNECNAGCLFCRDAKGVIYDMNPASPGKGTIGKGKMPLELCTQIIDQVKDDVLIAVLYTNGEPLLYKELPDVVKYCSDHRVMSMIATNGLLFTPENSAAILDAGIDFIKIQLSGFTQDVYGIQIRYGSVEKLKDNIRTLVQLNNERQNRAFILIDYILYNYNRHQLEPVKQFCDGLGLMLNTRPGNPKGGLEDREPPQSRAPLPLKMSCDWLWKGMQVNYNGDVLQCCDGVVYSGAEVYDTLRVGQTPVKDVWNGPSAIRMRERMTKKGRGDIDICSKCYREGVHFKW